MADINLIPIVMHRGNQSSLVAADIKDGEFPDLIGVREEFTQPGKIREAVLPSLILFSLDEVYACPAIQLECKLRGN